jgi:DNA-binding transcriptional MerR regulator
MNKLTIGKLAVKAGVGVETIRFYQRKNLLRIPSSVHGVRTYLEEDFQKLTFIKKVQELGFSLSEIKDLLELNTKPRVTCATVKKKSLEKLNEIEQKIHDLLKMKDALLKLSKVCDSTQDDYRQYKVQECFNIGSNCDC